MGKPTARDKPGLIGYGPPQSSGVGGAQPQTGAFGSDTNSASFPSVSGHQQFDSTGQSANVISREMESSSSRRAESSTQVDSSSQHLGVASAMADSTTTDSADRSTPMANE